MVEPEPRDLRVWSTWRVFRRVVEAVDQDPSHWEWRYHHPVAAKHMIELTGCHGISAGRGAFYNPWIFLHTQKYLETGDPSS